MANLTSQEKTEYVGLSALYRGQTEKQSRSKLARLPGPAQIDDLGVLRRLDMAQRRLSLEAPVAAPVAPARPRKVSYSLLLPPQLLEAIREASERDGSSVSQYIRTAVAQRLGREK
jgi:hypothetical protein